MAQRERPGLSAPWLARVAAVAVSSVLAIDARRFLVGPGHFGRYFPCGWYSRGLDSAHVAVMIPSAMIGGRGRGRAGAARLQLGAPTTSRRWPASMRSFAARGTSR
jgi:hypothetical protein